MRLAILTGQPFSEVLDWDDRDVATATRYLEEKQDAEKDAMKGRG
jgi:hypothetical protein